MAQKKDGKIKSIENYIHTDKVRTNNPPVGLVTLETDEDGSDTAYSFDVHVDPQLNWAGKTQLSGFDVPTVSLHVHERIDPRTIIESVRKPNCGPVQTSLFESPEENPPIRKAIEFYRHRHNWSNRLVAGDNLLVMNSLLEKEGLGGQVQMIFIDPPYGIKYGSNFQPFVNKREVKDGKDTDLTSEPEMIRAFRDTWELGIHSYLTYLRDRLLLARKLLHDSGSVFVQIGDENVHRVSIVLDEIFGAENRMATISFATTSSSSTSHLPEVADYLLWYALDKKQVKFRRLYETLSRAEMIDFFSSYVMLELPDGSCKKLSNEQRFDPDRHLPDGARIFRRVSLESQGVSTTGRSEPYIWNGRTFRCSPNRQWSISKEDMDRLEELKRLEALEGKASLSWKKYEDEVPGRRISNLWPIKMFPSQKKYVVETSTKVIQRCLLMTTDPGDLVFDPTCGSGTTAYVAEQWGRRWISCDTSRIALMLAKQRIMTSTFDYYKLDNLDKGVGGGFKYKFVPHVSPKVLASGENPEPIFLYDQPLIDRNKMRVCGPFTVEAVPAPSVKPLTNVEEFEPLPADKSVTRFGETLRQNEWREELLTTGIRGSSGQKIKFTRLEPVSGIRYLHAEGESRLDEYDELGAGDRKSISKTKRVVVSFGPDHAPLEQRQIERSLEAARTLVPCPEIIVFAAFQFDPEAAKDIDELNWEGVTLFKVQMNADLLTDDLKSKRLTNESFWLIGQPDVEMTSITDDVNRGKYQVSVKGFDYYNTLSGQLESGGEDKIAMWMLDTDYDGRSLLPRQVFFPMTGKRDGWTKLAKTLNAEIDTDFVEAYRGTVSLPFELGEQHRVAVKIIDNRGIESLKIIDEQIPPNVPINTNDPAKTFEDRVKELFSDVPAEEWAKLPADLIENLDHYLYESEYE